MTRLPVSPLARKHREAQSVGLPVGAAARIFRVGGSRFALFALLLLLLSGSRASAGNPWRLRCALMPAEQRVPAPVRAAALRFYPWVRPAATGLRSGPVYLVALSSNTAISRDGDEIDSAGYYLHRALVAIAPSYTSALTITGRRLGRGRRTTLGFSIDGATSCTVDPPVVSCGSRPLRFAAALRITAARTRWRIVRTELRIGRTGCFRIIASGRGLREMIPLAVPGPDYGTPGW